MEDSQLPSNDDPSEERPLQAVPAPSPRVVSSKSGELPRSDSLDASVKDGMACAVMQGAGETYVNVFNIFLQASTLQIGLLATLPPLIGAACQNIGVRMVERIPSRRKIMVVATFLQGLLWLPIALLPFLFGSGSAASYALLGLIIAFSVMSGLTAPVWNSLLGDLVPAETRGRFFGYRNRQTGIASFISLTAAGFLLDFAQRHDASAYGFLAIFLIAGAFRILSSRYLAKHEDPPFVHAPEDHFTFWQFVKRTKHSNFVKFVLFVASVNFAVHIAGPYFSVYMLRDLGITYWQFTIISAAQIVTQFMTMQHWGRLTDRFGNKRILNVCSFGVTLAPLFWLFTSSIPGILLIQAYSGFVWAGFNLAASNFIFDAVSPPKRARCVAYQSMINNVFILAGSMAGGFLATVLPAPSLLIDHLPVAPSPYVLLFLISGLGRAVAIFVFMKKFKEVREVDEIEHSDLIWHVVQIRPIAGATFRPFTGLFRGKKKPSGPVRAVDRVLERGDDEEEGAADRSL